MNEQQNMDEQRNMEAHEKMQEDNKINPNSIDAHWLQNQLNNYFEVTVAKQMEPELLEILNS